MYSNDCLRRLRPSGCRLKSDSDPPSAPAKKFRTEGFEQERTEGTEEKYYNIENEPPFIPSHFVWRWTAAKQPPPKRTLESDGFQYFLCLQRLLGIRGSNTRVCPPVISNLHQAIQSLLSVIIAQLTDMPAEQDNILVKIGF